MFGLTKCLELGLSLQDLHHIFLLMLSIGADILEILTASPSHSCYILTTLPLQQVLHAQVTKAAGFTQLPKTAKDSQQNI